MDNLREKLFPTSALPRHQHRQVYWSHTQCAPHRLDKRRSIAHYAETGLGLLNLLTARCHCIFFRSKKQTYLLANYFFILFISLHFLPLIALFIPSNFLLLISYVSLFISQLISAAAKEIGEFFLRTHMGHLLLDSDGIADSDVESLATFAEHLCRMAECAQLPAYHSQEIKPPRLRSMEKNRYHRHLQLLYQLNNRGLPFAVLQPAAPVDLGNRPGREKSNPGAPS